MLNSPIQSLLDRVHARYRSMNEGQVADYIPELALADPDWFGIAIATVDGHLYVAGDYEQNFTIQSISKAFTYGLALQECGLEKVSGKVGVEPSGDAFNAISLDQQGRPANPMINAGAIATTSLIKADNGQSVSEKILSRFSDFAAEELSIDDKVYHSESQTGHRNRAIGYMLRNFDIIEDDPMPVLEDYFQQCSVLVNCRNLAIMGATLANRGINPLTNKSIIEGKYIEKVLSVMSSCGMYDYSGNWLYHVGLPAKSGVGGGILTVLPGQMSIAVFSPPLDIKGNSCRGLKVVKDLSSQLNLHVFNAGNTSSAVIRAKLTLAQISSNRQRNMEEIACLKEFAQTAIAWQLQGYFSFASCEKVIRDIEQSIETRGFKRTVFIMLNLSRVFGITEIELNLLKQLLLDLKKHDMQMLFCDENNHAPIREFFHQDEDLKALLFSHQDDMIECVENEIISKQLIQTRVNNQYPLRAFAVCKGLDDAYIALLESILQKQSYSQGDVIISKGDKPEALYFLVHGYVDVMASVKGQMLKVSSISSGNLFGEMSIIDGGVRTANIVTASESLICYSLSLADYEKLNQLNVDLKINLLKNITADLALKLRHIRQLSEVESASACQTLV